MKLLAISFPRLWLITPYLQKVSVNYDLIFIVYGLKEAVGANLIHHPSRKKLADVKKLKKTSEARIKKSFEKKVTTLAGSLN